MPDNIYIFDFDGVICDSISEIFQTSLGSFLVYLELNSIKFYKFNNDDNEMISMFRDLFHIAGSSDQMKNIWCEIFTKKMLFSDTDLALKKIKNSHINYKKEFYIFREKLKNKSMKKWLSYHKIFDGFKDLLNNNRNANNFYIASAKDTNSIYEILKFNNINFDKNKIYSSSQDDDKYIIFNNLSKLSYKNRITLIDDNFDNLLIGLKFNFTCYHANWGQSYKKQNSEKKITEVTKNNLFEIIV